MIYQGMCDSFKQELLSGVHDFTALGAQEFKIALYGSSAEIGSETTAYTSTGEITSDGYTAGGKILSGQVVRVSNGIAYIDFDDSTWTDAGLSFTTRGAMIYNSSAGLGNAAVCVLDFGMNIEALASFTVTMPLPEPETAVIRIGRDT